MGLHPMLMRIAVQDAKAKANGMPTKIFHNIEANPAFKNIGETNVKTKNKSVKPTGSGALLDPLSTEGSNNKLLGG